jgi:CrcB protein
VPAEVRVGLLVGFVGGLTTFSSFSLDTIRLLENGQAPLAFGYAAASVLGGLLATWAGLSLTRI